jgi:inosose dehydratase
MTRSLSRRDFLAAGAAGVAGAALTPALSATGTSPAVAPPLTRANMRGFPLGITSNTRPEWNGAAGFLRSIDECSEIGYRMIETFWADISRWENDPAALKDEMQRRNLGFVTISNSGGMRTNFTDASQREGVIEDHMKLIRFIRDFGCDHLKINIGGDQPASVSQPAAVYREMAITFNEIGRRMTDMGMKFGIHAHLNSAFETRQDIDAIMDLTDPRHVYMILDTGHITMAGMDPVQLTRDYTDRIIEYHLKDTAAIDRGGTGRLMGRRAPRVPPAEVRARLEAEYPGVDVSDPPASIAFRDRHFFELGAGGVDFPAIMKVLTDANWSGWMTVELDSTVTTAKGSAQVTKEYLERILGLDVETPNQRANWST